MSAHGNAIVSIKNIVDDLPSTINWKQTVYEAITNSIQANATNIKINFIQDALDMEETKKYIIAIKIEDNGDGFTKDNLDAFKEYKTKHKRELGCKGIGRFLYLKVFENVHINSLDKTIDFEADKDIIDKDSSKIDNTILKLSKPKNKFVVDYEKFKEDIKEHFIAYFQLKQKKGIEIGINIYENKIEKERISSNDIPEFSDKKFKIKTHEFTIYYALEDIQQQEGYYCAGGRVVKKNSKLTSDKKLKIFRNLKIAYLVHSKYLDDNVVPDTRDDFTIYPKRKNSADVLLGLAWEDIQDDRFMTYDKLFSEGYIKDIFPKLYSNVDRIDLLSIASNTYNKEKITDVVLIELKKAQVTSPSKAQEELRKYANYINEGREEDKIRIWTYAFLKFGEHTERDLILDDYNKISTQSEYPIFYKYYDKINAIINFMDYRTIAYDAELRHKTFMKILSGKTL